MELVYTYASGAYDRKVVGVRVSPRAPSQNNITQSKESAGQGCVWEQSRAPMLHRGLGHQLRKLYMNLDSAVFYSNDIAKVVTFYRDILGFTVEYQQEDKYVSFIFPNGARLGIKKRIEEREIPGAQTVFIAPDQDITLLYEDLKQKGAPIYKELVDQAWGKNFSILDPDKNKVQFIEKTGA